MAAYHCAYYLKALMTERRMIHKEKVELSKTQKSLRRKIKKLPIYPYHTWDGGKSTKEYQNLIGLEDVLTVITKATAS
jgi:hypothetical protein